MGKRTVTIMETIEVELRVTIVWPDPGPSGALSEIDDDPREVAEIKGADHRDQHILEYGLEHGLLDEGEIEMRAIEAHDDIGRYEVEMDGYRLATRRMESYARELEIESRRVHRNKELSEKLLVEARAVREAQERVAAWRAHEERKAVALFRETPHPMETATQEQEEADDPISEARFFIALLSSDRVRQALGKDILDANA